MCGQLLLQCLTVAFTCPFSTSGLPQTPQDSKEAAFLLHASNRTAAACKLWR
jgi:hypothetical protein